MQQNITPIKKLVITLLDLLKEQIIQDCDDEEIAMNLSKFHPSSNIDYFNPNDYCNADKAMAYLGLGNNRKKFFYLVKKYNIKNYKVNNQPIGYKIDEIKLLSCKLKNK